MLRMIVIHQTTIIVQFRVDKESELSKNRFIYSKIHTVCESGSIWTKF
jgi:hypothetical protein